MDPQGQGKGWIKTREKQNDLQVSYLFAIAFQIIRYSSLLDHQFESQIFQTTSRGCTFVG